MFHVICTLVASRLSKYYLLQGRRGSFTPFNATSFARLARFLVWGFHFKSSICYSHSKILYTTRQQNRIYNSIEFEVLCKYIYVK